MALDLDEIITKGREVRMHSSEIVRLAIAIRDGVEDTALHADTIAALRTKALAAKANYINSSAAFQAAIDHQH